MSKAKLVASKELIAERHYDAARAVLETIDEDEIAKRLLKQIPQARSNRINLRSCSTLVGVLLGGIVIGTLIGNSSAVPTSVFVPTITETLGPSPTITDTPFPTPTPTVTLAPTNTATVAPTETPTPLVFNGTGSTVIGPVNIPVGLYRATFTTGGFGAVTITTSEGECGAGSGFLTPGLFNEMAGEATNGAEAVFTSRGCRALIEVSNVQEPWTLVFEAVN